ncbi:MAG: winged helix-turn-helix domain-containing protein [Candidatus Promineifilaceae bacterium]|nr:winged helix-turn-helix domain-containing protein [Candidatus Promineifilaceae bacterium]
MSDFHGRQAEVDQILGLLRNGQSVSLIGPRRIGKSSLLLHLCRPSTGEIYNLDPPNALFVLLDCQELGGSPAEEVFESLYMNIADAAADANLLLGNVQQPGTYRALDRIIHQVSKQAVPLIVLLDEFELLAANKHLTPYFFARLRGLTTKYGLAYLTASQRPLFAITAEEEILSSPFFNIFVTLPLGLYSFEEAATLFDQRLRNSKVNFSPELVQHLIHLVGPHPFFLHLGGYHAYHAIAQDGISSIEDNYFAVDEAIEVEAESHLSYLWHNLSNEEQVTLALANGSIDLLRQLEQQCLLSLQDGTYQYTSEILRRYVRRQEVEGIIQAGPFVIDQSRHQVWADNKLVNLTISQFSILVRLAQQAGQVVTGDNLEIAVWGEVLHDDPDRLKTLIKRLRRAIDPYSNWIVSERGVGYALRQPE